jgi:hypothetical protein
MKKYGLTAIVVYTFILSVYYWLTGYNDLAAAYLLAFAGWILHKEKTDE